MVRLELLPDYIKGELARYKVWPLDIVLLASSDLAENGLYCEGWVVLTKTQLIVMKGERLPEKTKPEKKSKKELAYKWHSLSNLFYPLEEIEELNSEGYTSGGILSARINNDDIVITRYTGAHNRKFGLFSKLFKKVKEGKELEDQDFVDDQAPSHCPKCGLLYPEPTRNVCPKCMDKRSLFLRTLSFVPRYKKQISLIILCMVLSSLLNLFRPYLEGRILFDEVLGAGGKYHGRILETVAIIFITQLVALAISVAYGRINAGVTAQVIYDLKTEVFTAMQRLSLSFYNSKQTGSLMTRVNHDAMHLQYFFHDGLPYFIVNSLTLIGIVITMLLINWSLTLMVLLPIPFIIYILHTMLPKLYEIFNRSYRKSRAMNSLINDTLTGMRVVKAFGKESEEISRFSTVNQGVCDVSIDSGKFASTMFPLLQFIMGLGWLFIWGIGGWQVIQGTLTFGTLVSFTGYLLMLYGPLNFMTQIINWWSSCMNSSQRIFEILDSIPEISEAKDAIRLPHMEGNIQMKDVTFSYEPNKPVLHNINLDIKAGEMIGLIGHSGAGKSTLTNIIARLYDVHEGSILIDGIDIKKLSIKDLRAQVGMVLQDTVLFSGSIAENIAFARPDAPIQDIIRAAKAANAHDFILKLPDGYDTLIGKKGQDLSGGEKQRLSIARAILHDPRILIMDEATASLDTETERQIQEALERLIKGRTTIAIAHRLSTLRNADRLVVINKGKIEEMGTHSELVKLKGAYYKMLQKQKEALKIKGVAE